MARRAFRTAVWACAILCGGTGCGTEDGWKPGQGGLSLAFDRGSQWGPLAVPGSRAEGVVPDTNDFLLTVRPSGGGESVYEGRYADRPAELKLPSGAYEVEAVSVRFDAPAYSRPQYGDRQVAVVPEGETVGARLTARPLNSGLRFRFDPYFAVAYAGWKLKLTGPDGALDYALTEKRIAYFRPGRIDIDLMRGEERIRVANRTLGEGEVLTVSLSGGGSVPGPSEGFVLTLDTARIWLEEELDLGERNDGQTQETAYTVPEWPDHIGEEDVWVTGYVVGGDLSSSSIRFEPPFAGETNLALGATLQERVRENCRSVELKSGKVRDALNLVSNPDVYGHRIWLKGDIVEAYFGLVGLKNVSDWSR